MNTRWVRKATARRLFLASGLLMGAATAQASPVSVRLVHPVARLAAVSYSALGRVETSDHATLMAPFDGVVTRVQAASGSAVLANAPLLTLKPLTLVARVQAARTAVASARTNLAQKRVLAAQKLITQGGLDTAEAEFAAQKARLWSLSAELALGAVRAPFAGTVRHVTALGSRVIRGQRLLRISGSRGLRIEAPFPLSEIRHLRIGAPARMESDGGAGVATVYAIAHTADAFGLVPVYLNVPKVLTLLPGEVVRVAIQPTQGRAAWVVPRGALVLRGQKASVFAYVGGRAQPIAVRVRAVQQETVTVAGPLTANTRLVRSGVAWLRKGTPVQIQPASAAP